MKAISPVIATVILVAVTIAVAIAVALWMSGMVGALTGIERIDIVERYVEINDVHYVKNESQEKTTGWIVHLKVKNTGTRDTTITNLFINDKPIVYYNTTTSITTTYTDDTDTYTTTYTIVYAVYAAVNTTTYSTPASVPTVAVPITSIPTGGEVYITVFIPGTGLGFVSGQMVTITLQTGSGGTYSATVTLP